MMNRLVVALDGGGVSPAVLGGKGAWLDRLVGAGFLVPPVAVVTTTAYHEVVEASPDLTHLLDELRSAADLPAPGQFATAQAEVDAAFAIVALTAEVRDAIEQAAALAGGDRLVARSSATAEDLSDSSFAGQYRSVIDVAPGAELERAVRAVWASLWYPSPRAYRRHRGVPDDRVGMAVVVMPLVAAVEAGVAFSRDPTDPSGPVRVERVEGQGEQLVSGAVTPTVDRLSRPGGLVDGTGHDWLSREVAGLAVAVERTLGEPQDIEWAWDGQKLWLLQARPITASTEDDGLETAVPVDHELSTAGIVEMLPGALPPLVWQVNAFVVEEGFRRLYDSLGSLPADPGGRLLVRCRARAALDQTALRRATRGLTSGAATARLSLRQRAQSARREVAALGERHRTA
ncbi:MAG TPA: PEP/pyruvate-binding domain-containing protein, partial [Acidimicrobiales bacterium]